jgi:hypothetical protein
MIWDQVRTWKQLRAKFASQRFGAIDDNGRGLEPSSARLSKGRQNDSQPTEFRPDDQTKRSEFSLHIGC